MDISEKTAIAEGLHEYELMLAQQKKTENIGRCGTVTSWCESIPGYSNELIFVEEVGCWLVL